MRKKWILVLISSLLLLTSGCQKTPNKERLLSNLKSDPPSAIAGEQSVGTGSNIVRDSIPGEELTESGVNEEPSEIKAEQGEETDADAFKDSIITWEEITESGVNEALLAESINPADLEKIATNLQRLCLIIAERERASTDYVLSAQWLHDYRASEEYQSVIDMGTAAMKPLYFIVYKSENQGLYEYICASALSELSDETFDMWATSKEFLERFNGKIIEKRS